MSVDLESIHRGVTNALTSAVLAYRQAQSQSARRHSPISGVELTFGVIPPTIGVSFDTREEPLPDGDATHPNIVRIEYAELQRMLTPRGDVVSLRYPDGSWKEVDRGAFHQTLAEFLIRTMREARAAGTFASVAAPGRPMVTLTFEDGSV